MQRYVSKLPRKQKPTKRPKSGIAPTHTRFLEHSTNLRVLRLSARLVLPMKVSSLSTAKHETNRLPVIQMSSYAL
jgi:hypothetical protein